jgi:Ca2+-binding EF-hand superfamily protein
MDKERDMKTTLSLMTLALLATTAAWAQPGPGGPPGRMMFSRLDTNGDGQISAEEFRAGRPNTPDDLFAKLDTDGNGQLSPEELQGMREHARQMMAERFAQLDTDGDNALSLPELQAGNARLTAEQFNRLDRNGDGLLSRDEWPPRRGRFRRR